MPRKLALIIGNSHYQDPQLARLVAPGEDVADLTDVLRDAVIGGFDQVTPLINETDAAVRLSIEDFFADKKPDDLLVIYFSGHGVRDEQGRFEVRGLPEGTTWRVVVLATGGGRTAVERSDPVAPGATDLHVVVASPSR